MNRDLTRSSIWARGIQCRAQVSGCPESLCNPNAAT
jgi:hypothetical protein